MTVCKVCGGNEGACKCQACPHCGGPLRPTTKSYSDSELGAICHELMEEGTSEEDQKLAMSTGNFKQFICQHQYSNHDIQADIASILVLSNNHAYVWGRKPSEGGRWIRTGDVNFAGL